MAMSMEVATEHLMDADGILSVCMSVINAHLDDNMTLAMKEDIYYALHGCQGIVERVMDKLPVDADIQVKNYPVSLKKEGGADAAVC